MDSQRNLIKRYVSVLDSSLTEVKATVNQLHIKTSAFIRCEELFFPMETGLLKKWNVQHLEITHMPQSLIKISNFIPPNQLTTLYIKCDSSFLPANIGIVTHRHILEKFTLQCERFEQLRYLLAYFTPKNILKIITRKATLRQEILIVREVKKESGNGALKVNQFHYVSKRLIKREYGEYLEKMDQLRAIHFAKLVTEFNQIESIKIKHILLQPQLYDQMENNTKEEFYKLYCKKAFREDIISMVDEPDFGLHYIAQPGANKAINRIFKMTLAKTNLEFVDTFTQNLMIKFIPISELAEVLSIILTSCPCLSKLKFSTFESSNLPKDSGINMACLSKSRRHLINIRHLETLKIQLWTENKNQAQLIKALISHFAPTLKSFSLQTSSQKTTNEILEGIKFKSLQKAGITQENELRRVEIDFENYCFLKPIFNQIQKLTIELEFKYIKEEQIIRFISPMNNLKYLKVYIKYYVNGEFLDQSDYQKWLSLKQAIKHIQMSIKFV
ncbi:hypothetical protein FGO68_gene15096 [Halteria grandinella]|uniref:Uncharacterized protein n=1 Tax=Halteria grandinella TaxID=5974 RepID=A0A8J8T4C4_HALGN|nr:hypothetical protein FGO68_gene15096 [Halteria grandinella]